MSESDVMWIGGVSQSIELVVIYRLLFLLFLSALFKISRE